MHILQKIRFVQTPSSKTSSPLFSTEYAQCLQQHFLCASSSHLTQLLRYMEIFWTPVIYRITWTFFTHKANNTSARKELMFMQGHPWFFQLNTKFFLVFPQIYPVILNKEIREILEFLKLGDINFPSVRISNLFNILNIGVSSHHILSKEILQIHKEKEENYSGLC